MFLKKIQFINKIPFFILILILFNHLTILSVQETNILIYGDKVQVDSYINTYENVQAGIPITGTIMITHEANNQIDPASFRIGSKPLQIKFLQSSQPSPYSNLIISIYQFTLEGQKKGVHTFPPIKVKVGGQEYEAAPLTVEVAG